METFHQYSTSTVEGYVAVKLSNELYDTSSFEYAQCRYEYIWVKVWEAEDVNVAVGQELFVTRQSTLPIYSEFELPRNEYALYEEYRDYGAAGNRHMFGRLYLGDNAQELYERQVRRF